MKINYYIIIIILITISMLCLNSKKSIVFSEQTMIVALEEVRDFELDCDGNIKQPIFQKEATTQKKIYITRFSSEVPTLDKVFLLLKVKVVWEIENIITYNKIFPDFIEAKDSVWDYTELILRKVMMVNKKKDILNEINKAKCNRDIEIEIIRLLNDYFSKKGISIINIKIKYDFPN